MYLYFTKKHLQWNGTENTLSVTDQHIRKRLQPGSHDLLLTMNSNKCKVRKYRFSVTGHIMLQF